MYCTLLHHVSRQLWDSAKLGNRAIFHLVGWDRPRRDFTTECDHLIEVAAEVVQSGWFLHSNGRTPSLQCILDEPGGFCACLTNDYENQPGTDMNPSQQARFGLSAQRRDQQNVQLEAIYESLRKSDVEATKRGWQFPCFLSCYGLTHALLSPT